MFEHAQDGVSSTRCCQRLRNRPNALYNFYQDVFGINVVETDERVRVARANELESAHLGVEVGAALLEIRRIAYSYHRNAVELRMSRLNTDEYEYIGARGRCVTQVRVRRHRRAAKCDFA
ncbi:UTRA domain-containing protein [Paraburkholderia sp. DGU8]|uniref:UTRA domain-containing protein n=1 Tax=Paraburkholderia sp. DGU8 TaxID=3161997 RepID=UPI003467B051